MLRDRLVLKMRPSLASPTTGGNKYPRKLLALRGPYGQKKIIIRSILMKICTHM